MRLLPFLLLVVLAAPVRANMANPVQPGTPAGEPAAALDGLRVAREALTLDLRPLDRGRPFAVVEATYRIVNTGAGRAVPLDFVALGEGVDGAEVWVDEQPVAVRRIDSLAVPPLWTIATSTPALGGDALPYEADDGFGTPTGLRFEAPIPTGQHTVRVRYRVRLGSYDAGDHPNRVWQLAYSLAPARLWDGFGQLDVAVLVPEAWEAAASLPLRRAGGRLEGRFRGVPGDVLAVSVRAPAPALRLPLRVAGFLTAFVIVGFFGVVSGKLAKRSGRGVWWALPGTALGGIVAGVALVALVATADDLGDSAAYGYGTILGLMFFGGPLAILVGAALTQAVAVWTHRRTAPAPPPSEERYRLN